MIQHDLQVPVALITGSARRIGAAIASHLHQAGYRVIIHYHHSADEAHALAQTLNQQRADSAHTLTADLCAQDAASLLIANTIDWAGKLNLLVNNASVFIRTNLNAPDYADWDLMFNTNVKAPFALSQAAFPHLAALRGAIINITDAHADIPLKEYAVYCQTKAALTMQTKALAREFAPNVRVNAVAPGAIIWPEGDNTLSTESQQKIIAKTPLQRHGDPLFIAQAVLALAENPFITGQSLTVDGGRSLLA